MAYFDVSLTTANYGKLCNMNDEQQSRIMENPAVAIHKKISETMTEAERIGIRLGKIPSATGKKRGRPYGINGAFIRSDLRTLTEYVGLTKHGRRSSERSVMNRLFANIAVASLEINNPENAQRYLYIYNPTAHLISQRAKLTILAELGRIEIPDLIRRWADLICNEKTPTRTAIKSIRAWRKKHAYELKQMYHEYMTKDSRGNDGIPHGATGGLQEGAQSSASREC